MADKKKKEAAQAGPAPAEETAAPAAETAAPAEEAQTPDEADEKKNAADAALEEAKKQAAEANDKWLRTLAEYDNFRRRSQKEKEALYGDAKADTLAKILPVLDNFERAAAAGGDLESYKKGVEMTVRQLGEILTGMGVTSFGEAGEPFDPNIHSGVMHVDDENLPENVVAEVFQRGYRLGDRIIRHAAVKVAN